MPLIFKVKIVYILSSIFDCESYDSRFDSIHDSKNEVFDSRCVSRFDNHALDITILVPEELFATVLIPEELIMYLCVESILHDSLS